jgi:predicted 5'-methylthioadenosine/S-adenosylhomocysteine nucleosidase
VSVLVVSATRAEAAHVPAGLDVLVCGVGKVEAAVRTAEAIARLRPSQVVNVGTCGALREGVTGLFEPSRVVNHDFDAAGIRALGYDVADEVTLAGGDGSVLATGDRFVTDPVVRDGLATRASLVDMEGYAIVRAAQAFDVPVRLVKVVSDGADESALDWPAVVDGCARRLGEWLAAHV